MWSNEWQIRPFIIGDTDFLDRKKKIFCQFIIMNVFQNFSTCVIYMSIFFSGAFLDQFFFVPTCQISNDKCWIYFWNFLSLFYHCFQILIIIIIIHIGFNWFFFIIQKWWIIFQFLFEKINFNIIIIDKIKFKEE